MMSIRLKLFAAFALIAALAIGLASYGFYAISSTGQHVTGLYNGALMGISHARAAHAALNEARLIVERSRINGASKDEVQKFEKVLSEIREDLNVVHERVKDDTVSSALRRAESRASEWAEASLMVLKPPPGGLASVPASYWIAEKGQQAIEALDDLVETVAASGFEERMATESMVVTAQTTMLSIAIGTVLVGLILAFAFAASMSRPIADAMLVAERVAKGNFTDRIEVRRRDELGRLLTSLAEMQASLKLRADQDLATIAAKEHLNRKMTALNATNEAILRAENGDQLFKLVCESLLRSGEFTTTAVFVPVPDRDILRGVAASGAGSGLAQTMEVSSSEDRLEGKGLAGTAFRTRQLCVSNDYLNDPRFAAFHEVVRKAGARSGAALPLLSRDRMVGIIMLMSPEVNAFSPEVIQLIERLASNVSYALDDFDRIEERRQAEERIRYLATHDNLTGLPNRAMFNHLFDQSIKSARRLKEKCAVLFIDLDRFKVINDSLGHAAGDQLLIEVARRLGSSVRESDIVARLGGDEFVVILNHVGGADQIAVVARKILSSLITPLDLAGHECRTTGSIGIAVFPDHGDDAHVLTKNADVAMYLAKEEGKNDFRFFSPDIKSQSIERLMLETSMRHALELNQFSLHYQPKIDASSGGVNGVEALLRWTHPDLGNLPPAKFISLAEETGLIVPIGRWVLRTACAQNMAWQAQGIPELSIAVNLSPRQFQDEHLLRDIDNSLKETGMPARLLQLEITESMVMQDVGRAIKVLDQIQSRGIRLAIDDFGTGYSSMSLMKQFPIDTLKIDRSFIRDLAEGENDRAITTAIISMAKALGLTVVAEGVETTEQDNFLRTHACDELQGYLFSRPVPADEITTLLRPRIASPALQPDADAAAASGLQSQKHRVS